MCRSAEASPERDDFFGVAENAAMSAVEVERSKKMCKVCPVRRECLKAALSGEEDWGVWGGYTAPERKRAVEAFGSTWAIMEAFDDQLLDQVVVRRVR